MACQPCPGSCQHPRPQEDRASVPLKLEPQPALGPGCTQDPLSGPWPEAPHLRGVHQQMQSLTVSGFHQAQEAGLVLRGPVTDAALGKQAGEAGPPEPPPPPHPALPVHSRSARRIALPSCGCSGLESPRWLPRSEPHPPAQFGWTGACLGSGGSGGASAEGPEWEAGGRWPGWGCLNTPPAQLQGSDPPLLWVSDVCSLPWPHWRAGLLLLPTV